MKITPITKTLAPAIILLCAFALLGFAQLSLGAGEIVDPVNGGCQDGFVKFKFSTAVREGSAGSVAPFDKCIQKGTAQYNQVFKNAKLVGNTYEASAISYEEAAGTRLIKLGTGEVGGTVQKYVVNVPIPCQPLAGGNCPSADTPAGYVGRLYQFSLMIVGLLAFASIVFGSLKYILSAGNLASLDEAKDQIRQAIFGVILLLGAYLILYTINPDLVNIRNPQLEPINIQQIRQDAQIAEDLQRIPADSGTTGGGDPLCTSAVNTRITINTSPVGNSKCVTCTSGAVLGSSGVCECGTDYLRFEDGCIQFEECTNLGYKREVVNGNLTCVRE